MVILQAAIDLTPVIVNSDALGIPNLVMDTSTRSIVRKSGGHRKAIAHINLLTIRLPPWRVPQPLVTPRTGIRTTKKSNIDLEIFTTQFL
jgi:hypothetical protein